MKKSYLDERPSPVAIPPPPLYDIPLDDTHFGQQHLDDEDYFNDHDISKQRGHSDHYDHSSSSGVELPDTSTCCNAKAFCTLLTISVFFLAIAVVVLAIFHETRQLSLVVFVPLLSVSLFSCLALMCYMSYSDYDLPVIEPFELSIPETKKEHHKDDGDNEDTAPTSCGCECENQEAKEESNILATSFPELYNFLQDTQKIFDQSREFLITRIFRPASTSCAPVSTPLSNRSIFAHRASARELSIANIIGPDIECCVDVHCQRDEHGAINLTGTYKLVHNNKFDEFLKVLHVPKLLRKAADSAKPTHKYFHKGDIFRVQIDGVLKSDSTFVIGGPPSPSHMRHHKFLDHMSYLEDKKGIVTRKVLQNGSNKAIHQASEIIVTRQLSNDGKRMILTSRAMGADGIELAKSVQTFLRVDHK